MELIWPSTEFVRSCLHGYEAGSAICFNAKNLANAKSILRLKF